jgi:hypothetical protein
MFFTEIDRFQDQGSGFKVQRLQPIDIAHNIDHNPQNPTQPIGTNGFLITIKTGSL